MSTIKITVDGEEYTVPTRSRGAEAEESEDGSVLAPSLRLSEAARYCADTQVLEGVQFFAWGEVKHPGGDFNVDQGFADKYVAAFNALTTDGWFPPVLTEHEKNGRINGQHVRAYYNEEGIFGDLEVPAWVFEAIEAGELRWVSPSFFETFIHPHTGEELTIVPSEVSFVSKPHLKNLKPLPGSPYQMNEHGFIRATRAAEAEADIHDTPDTERDMADATQSNEEEKPNMEMTPEMIEAIKSVVIAVLDEREAAEAEDEEMEEQGEETENSEVAKLQRRIALMEARENVRKDLPGADDQTVTDLTEIRIAAPKAYGRQVARLKELSERGDDARDFSEVGTTGSAAGRVTLLEATAEARAAGCKPGRPIVEFIKEKYPGLG